MTHSERTFDVIVIGGGVVGGSLAYHLARGGRSTLLLDRLDQGRASDAGAGIVSPETYGDKTETWIDFAIQARDYYPELLSRLEEDGAAETGYGRPGMLVVAVDEDEMPAFEHTRSEIFNRQERLGGPPADSLRPIEPSLAKKLFPPLAATRGAVYFQHAARVDGRLLNQAFLKAGASRGLQIRRQSATRLMFEKGRLTGVETKSHSFQAGAVAIAGGAWSSHFARQLGVDIPVVPQRGQILHLGLPGIETGGWPMVSAFHGHYLVPWPGGRVVAGATREHGSGFQPHATAAGVREALVEALRVAPGLEQARLLEIRVGLRPMSPDGSPMLGLATGHENVFLATGHGPNGLTIGPYSGKVIADLIMGQPSAVDLEPFSVRRFA